MTVTEVEMYALADQVGVHVARHRLNGRPRYRFFSTPMDFDAGDGLGTVIGTRAALTWLRGYEAALPASQPAADPQGLAAAQSRHQSA
jgi:hypothetical protein